jgi:hypothetical protein
VNDFGLDVAVIGNARTAGLLERSPRLLWRCFSRCEPFPAELSMACDEDVPQYRHRGLLEEDVHLQTGQLYGKIRETCPVAGLVLTAIRLSRSWEDRQCHD